MRVRVSPRVLCLYYHEDVIKKPLLDVPSPSDSESFAKGRRGFVLIGAMNTVPLRSPYRTRSTSSQ